MSCPPLERTNTIAALMKLIHFAVLLLLPFKLFAGPADYRDLPRATPDPVDLLSAAGIETSCFRHPIDNNHGCMVTLRLKRGGSDKEIAVCRKMTREELKSRDGIDVIVTFQNVRGVFGRRKVRVGYVVAGCAGAVMVSARNLGAIAGNYAMLDPEKRVLLAAEHGWAKPDVADQKSALYLKVTAWDGD